MNCSLYALSAFLPNGSWMKSSFGSRRICTLTNCMCLSQIIKLLNVKRRVNAMSAFNKTLPAPYEVALYLTCRKTLRASVIQQIKSFNDFDCKINAMPMIYLSITVTHVKAFSTDLPKTIVYCTLLNSLFHCSMCFLSSRNDTQMCIRTGLKTFHVYKSKFLS